MSELLPCPFCGGASILAHDLQDADGDDCVSVFLRCATCDAQGPIGDWLAGGEAAWNRRAPLSSAILPNEQERVTNTDLLPTGQGEGLREAVAMTIYERARERLRALRGRHVIPAWRSDKMLPESVDIYLSDADAILSTIRGEGEADPC